MGLNWGVALESLEFLSWRKHCSVQPYQVHFVTESQDFALIYSLSPVVTKQSISNALFPRWAYHGDTARSAKSIECISQYKNIVGHSSEDKNIGEHTPNQVLGVLGSQNDVCNKNWRVRFHQIHIQDKNCYTRSLVCVVQSPEKHFDMP